MTTPYELRELARTLERDNTAIVDENEVETWQDEYKGWAEDAAKTEDESDTLIGEPPPFPGGDPYTKSLIIDALRDAADLAELRAALA